MNGVFISKSASPLTEKINHSFDTFPTKPVILVEGKVHSLSSGKGKMFLCAECHAFTPECVKKLNRHCGSGSDYGVVHVQAPNGNSA